MDGVADQDISHGSNICLVKSNTERHCGLHSFNNLYFSRENCVMVWIFFIERESSNITRQFPQLNRDLQLFFHLKL